MAGELLGIVGHQASLGVRLQFAREFSDAEQLLALMIVIFAVGIAIDGVFGVARWPDQAPLGAGRSMSRGFVIWFTGLSGAGKSTLAERVGAELRAHGSHVEILDGDEVRTHLSKGLGFSKEDRDTNIRRIGYVARLVARSGGVAIAAAISPYREIRDEIRAQSPGFFEVYVRASLDELVRRDVKGLYKKALAGELANFTGVSDPYEPPLNPELVVDSELETVQQSTDRILGELARRRVIAGAAPTRLIEGEKLADARAGGGWTPPPRRGPSRGGRHLHAGIGRPEPAGRLLDRGRLPRRDRERPAGRRPALHGPGHAAEPDSRRTRELQRHPDRRQRP